MNNIDLVIEALATAFQESPAEVREWMRAMDPPAFAKLESAPDLPDAERNRRLEELREPGVIDRLFSGLTTQATEAIGRGGTSPLFEARHAALLAANLRRSTQRSRR